MAKTTKVKQNKNGTSSTFTKVKCNGKTTWKKSGGCSTSRSKKR